MKDLAPLRLNDAEFQRTEPADLQRRMREAADEIERLRGLLETVLLILDAEETILKVQP